MLRTHRAGKCPGGCGGWGLGSVEQKGPRRALHSWSQRAGDLTWEPSRLPGLECAGQPPASPLLLWSWRAPPTYLSCSPLSLLPMPPGPMWPRGVGGPGEWGTSPGSSADSWGPSGRGSRPVLLSCSSCRAPPACFSLSPAPWELILSGLHFSSPLSPTMSYRFTWEFLLSTWASGSPTSGWQAP